ncbi:PrsW family intramembrane metalloprotease [Halococcus agarilyticus]|uniref:PrsW family intramembrane metalloprotease n=1 Tax=Halococcus agarilyticus TaxID=1232219 RepID=UPI00067798BE|nr:PrsW family intramembrane metalloprotease [Halococcus agarilyticus]
MTRDRDPIAAKLGSSRDLYDISTWDPRTRLDRLAVRVHGGLTRSGRSVVVAVAVLILVAQSAVTALAVYVNPTLGVFMLLSIVPAFALAGYIWYEDVTIRQPLKPLVVTFLLGVLFAGFAAIINTVLERVFGVVPIVGLALFFYLVVGPLEETVKWAAVRFYAYEDHFDAVIDGAIYGAVAGLGFATIENSLYITQQFLAAAQTNTGVLQATVGITLVRSFAGPGHVIYTSISGYYLGLARFNPESAGPIMVKGLLVAAFVHGTYNTLATYLPLFIPFTPIVFVAFVLLYDGVAGGYLLRKLSRYRSAYSDAMRHDREESAADAGD